MIFPYFPGCTLHEKAKGFDATARESAEKLGFTLQELPDWTCCGATFPLAQDNNMALLSPARVIAQGQKAGGDLVSLCAICHNVLKRTQFVLKNDPARRETVMGFIEEEFDPSMNVLHYLEVLRDRVGFEAVAAKVEKPLKGLNVAAYYGCLLLRPAAEMGFDDPERPVVMENLLTALGATPIDFPMKTECCSAFQVVHSEATATRCSREIIESARRAGADLIVTACPLCQFNLEDRQKEMGETSGFKSLPVLYFTELLGLALGLGEGSVDATRHYVPWRAPLVKAGVVEAAP